MVCFEVELLFFLSICTNSDIVKLLTIFFMPFIYFYFYVFVHFAYCVERLEHQDSVHPTLCQSFS